MPDFNVAVRGRLQPTDVNIIFGDEEVLYIENTQYETLCRDLGVYKSATAAKNAGRAGDLPLGYSELKASKLCRIFLWNPSE